MDVRNTGAVAGDEVVQLYVTHVGSRVVRPLKELRGFQRLTLAPNEKRTVQIPLHAESLAYWDEAADRWVVEQDQVKIAVGASSADTKLEKTIAVMP